MLIDAQDCENHNQKMLDIYKKIEENELRWEEIQLEDAEVVIVAYGTPARISITAAEQLRAKGIKAGVIRPITLWPFPYKQIRDAVSNDSVKQVLVVEMSTGQMLDDVKIAVGEQKPVHFYGRYGGVIPTVSEIAQAVERIVQEVK